MGDTICCCRRCGEPLVSTFERPQLEWHCMGCGAWAEFLHASWSDRTDERVARHAELVALFKTGLRGPMEAAR